MSLEVSTKSLQVKPSSTLAITAKVKEMKAAGEDAVGFCAGEPDFNTPENIRIAAIDAINQGFTKYTPASGANDLKAAVSKKFHDFNHLEYTPEQIVISNGGKHSLTNIFNVILNEGDEVIIPVPYWLSYPEMVKLSGGVPVFIHGDKSNGYKVTAKQIRDAVTDKTKAFVLNTPSNPTGMIYTEEELRAIAEVVVEKDFYVVADEMYEALVYNEKKHVSIASLGEEIYKRTITCSGLSKSYAMTGWRIGYTGSDVKLAKLMGAMQSHATSNPNSIAQKAAVEALNGSQKMVEFMRGEFDKRRKYLVLRVNGMSHVSCFEPDGAFYVYVDVSDVISKSYHGEIVTDAAKMAELLLRDYKVAVIPCADFGAPDHIRLSYAISQEQIEKGMNRMEEFLKEVM